MKRWIPFLISWFMVSPSLSMAGEQASSQSSAAASPEDRQHIWVIDAQEFAFIQNKKGKERYAAELVPHLKALNIKEGTFDPATADWHELYEIMSSPSSYEPLVAKISSLCSKPMHRRTCLAMERLRIQSLKWNREHPEEEP